MTDLLPCSICKKIPLVIRGLTDWQEKHWVVCDCVAVGKTEALARQRWNTRAPAVPAPPEGVTDEMVERALEALHDFEIVTRQSMRAALEAARAPAPSPAASVDELRDLRAENDRLATKHVKLIESSNLCVRTLHTRIAALEAQLAECAEASGNAMREAAATECDRCSEFLHKEAHSGGDFEHLMTRKRQAEYLAGRIRALRSASASEGGEK